MATYIALLRGINVGTAKRVPMADLRILFSGLGYKEVKTLLNSGNVVFSDDSVSKAAAKKAAAPSEPRIEKAFEERFGFSSRITVIHANDLIAAVEGNPLPENPNPSRFLIAFLKTPEHRRHLAALEGAKWEPEAFALGARVAYLWCPEGVLASPLAQAVNMALKDSVTIRNWNTVLKLHALVKQAS
jgi:uncharacterized protein (DUF1697 family)